MAASWITLVLGIMITTQLCISGNTKVPKKEKYYLKPGEHCMVDYYKTKEDVDLQQAVDICMPCPDGQENKHPESVIHCKKIEKIAPTTTTTTTTTPPATHSEVVTTTTTINPTTEKRTTKTQETPHMTAKTTAQTTNSSTGSIPVTDRPEDETDAKDDSDKKDQSGVYAAIAVVGVLVIIAVSFGIDYKVAKGKKNKKTPSSPQEVSMMESGSTDDEQL